MSVCRPLLDRPSEQLVRHDGALGDFRVVHAEASQRQQLASVASLRGAIAQLDDSDALSGEQSVFFGFGEQEELTLIV